MKHFLLFLVVIFSSMVMAESMQGRIVAVTDGDTLTLLDQENQVHTVRLLGIDSPEKGQNFGQVAKQQLAILAFGREATAYCRKRDRYRRAICVVKVDVIDIGFEQISRGMAWWYYQYASEQMPAERIAYEKAELEAKNYGRGLWQETAPVPPWEWRRVHHPKQPIRNLPPRPLAGE